MNEGGVILNLIIWLAPWVAKINQIAFCDWLPEQARWSYLVRSGFPAVSPPKKIDQAFSVKMAGYYKLAKKNLANIQPSWPKKFGR